MVEQCEIPLRDGQGLVAISAVQFFKNIMTTSTIKLSLLGLTVLALTASPLRAADKMDASDAPKKAPQSKAERTGAVGPFHGELTAKTDASITLKDRVFEVTSTTKITKDGKPATLADAKIGDAVGGQFRKDGGKQIALSIRFGEKPAEKEKAKHEKAPAKTETKQ